MIDKQKSFLNFLLIFTYLAIIIGIFSSLFVRPIGQNNVILDDGYMFVRYADNLLNKGQIAWNPNGPSTFGLTSILYWAIVVVPIRYFVDSISATAIIASFLSGCLFLALMVLMVMKQTSAGPVGKRVIALFMLILVTSAQEALTTHFFLGMDTLFAMAGLTVYILLSKWHEQSGSWVSMCIVGLAGGVLGAVRPDLLLYSFIIPGAMILFSQESKSRWHAVGICAITFALLSVMVGTAAYYLNSPLPLPFYVKGLKLYGDAFYRLHKYDAFVHAKEFIDYHRLLLSLLIFGIVYRYKGWWGYMTPVDRGIIGAAILFFFYFLLFVTPVTGRAARFYYPLLPVIVFLSVRTFSFYFIDMPQPKLILFRGSHQENLLLFTSIFIILTPYFYSLKDLSKMPTYSFDVHTHYTSSTEAGFYWFALDQMSELPADLSIATTEIGLVGVMNPTKTVIDLSGLNDSDIAHHGFSVERLLQTHHPDLIYLPHPHYQEMVTEMINNSRFKKEYTYFSARQLNTLMGVALYKDSKYYSKMLQIVQSNYDGAPETSTSLSSLSIIRKHSEQLYENR